MSVNAGVFAHTGLIAEKVTVDPLVILNVHETEFMGTVFFTIAVVSHVLKVSVCVPVVHAFATTV